MKKIFFLILSILGLNLLIVKQTLAVCPICTVIVGTGVGLSRYLGIDDTITGLWIGALIISMIAWTESWLDRKNVRFKGRIIVNTLGYYIVVLLPLYLSGIIGHPQNRLFCFCGINIDKLLFGIITGSLAFWFGASWYFYLKEKNNGRAYFPFQKVVMPIIPLLILSIIYYFLTK